MEDKWILESPVLLGERDSAVISIQFPWAAAATVDASSLIVYRGSTDVTSTIASGSNSYSGNRITLKTLSGMTGGETYVLSILVTLDGIATEYKLQVHAAKSSDEIKGRWASEDAIVHLPRTATPYSVSFSGATSVTVNATTGLKVYKNGTDVTSTYTSGTNTASGRVVTSKTITGLAKGTYVCSLLATVDGVGIEVKWKLKTPESYDNQ